MGGSGVEIRGVGRRRWGSAGILIRRVGRRRGVKRRRGGDWDRRGEKRSVEIGREGARIQVSSGG